MIGRWWYMVINPLGFIWFVLNLECRLLDDHTQVLVGVTYEPMSFNGGTPKLLVIFLFWVRITVAWDGWAYHHLWIQTIVADAFLIFFGVQSVSASMKQWVSQAMLSWTYSIRRFIFHITAWCVWQALIDMDTQWYTDTRILMFDTFNPRWTFPCY